MDGDWIVLDWIKTAMRGWKEMVVLWLGSEMHVGNAYSPMYERKKESEKHVHRNQHRTVWYIHPSIHPIHPMPSDTFFTN